ncbi:hypothetical protein [Nocardia jinanensis]|uniref:Uncharacterized protein n=1 Tax=Nocardia jinanensis TaxID=382504 RepID=A0A917VYB5_9NOCA|nr:hypothetical protein [Nocardia jinanensis]GGL45059.1 hypothetical protein GCM10011588_69630 [Nocardia jinanensis]
MVDIVRIRLIRPGLWSIAPPGSPTPADADPSLDTAVLEVGGGYLSWSLLADQRVPAATLHDLDTAQEWLWALYGAEIAVAADEYTGPVDMPARPERPELAAAIRRLGYAHWAARWWPASTVDGIPALDPAELDREIAELSEFCDSVVDGSDAPAEAAEPDPAVASAHGSGLGRAADYALAAGGQPRDSRTALILERGSAGWDWRHCPPGVVDASERAVSWELERVAGGNTLRVRAVAAPGLHGEPPEHLRPRALVRTSAGTRGAALALNGDTWTAAVPDSGETVTGVEIYVPGVGPSAPGGSDPSPDPDPRPADPAADARQRDRIRELAHARLRRAGPTAVALAYAAGEPAAGLADIELLRAEIAAAEADSDF